MYKNKILDFANEQSIEAPTIENNEVKNIRRQGDVSKWFDEKDIIEFDDSVEAFTNITDGMDILDSFKKIKLKIYRNGDTVDIKKEPFHCMRELNKCIAAFFVYGG